MDEHNELERLVGPLLADPPIPRTPVTEIRRRAARRTRQRMAAVGIAAAVVLLAAGTALAMSGRERTDVQVGTGPGTTVNPGFDLAVFLDAHATPAQIAATEAVLTADPNVTAIVYSTQADAYVRFQCLFSDQTQLIESVQPAELPASFSVDIVGGQVEMARLSSRLDHTPAVKELGLPPGSPYHVSEPTTTPGPGEETFTIPPGASRGTMQYAPSSTPRQCPVIGTTIR